MIRDAQPARRGEFREITPEDDTFLLPTYALVPFSCDFRFAHGNFSSRTSFQEDRARIRPIKPVPQ